MNKTTAILSAAFLLLVAALAFLGGYATCRRFRPADIISTTDTVWRWHTDTVILRDSKPVGSAIAVLPTVAPPVRDTARNGLAKAKTDTVFVRDSVAVEIPIEQRTYEGEYYKAVVQGWRPELVAIDIRLPEVNISATPRKRWSVTVGPQVGYGFTPAGWQPYAGVGITAGITF